MNKLEIGGYCYEANLTELDISFFDNYIPPMQNKESVKRIKEYSRDNQNKLFLEIIDNI